MRARKGQIAAPHCIVYFSRDEGVFFNRPRLPWHFSGQHRRTASSNVRHRCADSVTRKPVVGLDRMHPTAET